MKKLLVGLWVMVTPCALALAMLSACGDDAATATPSDAGGSVLDASDSGIEDGGPEAEASSDDGLPQPSRPTATACSRPMPRPVGNASSDGGADASIDCTLDSDCTAGAGGRCSELRTTVWFGGKSLGTRCTYDACTTDDECGSGVCGCDLGFAGQNVCLPQGNCRVDSECPQGQVCSFSSPLVLNSPGVIVTGNELGGGNGVPRESLGWFCTTPRDECKPGERKDGAGEGCVYGTDRERWIWWYQP